MLPALSELLPDAANAAGAPIMQTKQIARMKRIALPLASLFAARVQIERMTAA